MTHWLEQYNLHRDRSGLGLGDRPPITRDADQSIYASCPSWSHVTWEQDAPWNG